MSTPDEVEAQLTIRDRINYPYILGNQLITIQKAILSGQYGEAEIAQSVEALVHIIPDEMTDDRFKEEVEEAIIETEIDVRPTFCGVRLSVAICKEQGYPISYKSQDYDYMRLLHACVNLLYRRGMITKRVFTEIMTYERAHGKNLDEAVELGENAET